MSKSEERKAANREYMREYTQRPGYKEHKRAYDAARHAAKMSTPEGREEKRLQSERANKRRLDPVTRSKERARERELMKDPERLAKKLARNKMREQRKARACPDWLTRRHLKQIEAFYITRPIGWHVDHIVPLNGENVSGLHVPWNLQHLPSTDNIRKGNQI